MAEAAQEGSRTLTNGAQTEKSDFRENEDRSAAVGPLDMDFLIFAMPLAGLLDVFGFLSIFISFGILGFLVSLLFGIPLVFWLVAKEGNLEAAKERIRELRTAGAGARRRAGRQVARRLLRRGMRKLFVKLIVGSILVFLPYWTWSVVRLLWQR